MVLFKDESLDDVFLGRNHCQQGTYHVDDSLPGMDVRDGNVTGF